MEFWIEKCDEQIMKSDRRQTVEGWHQESFETLGENANY